MRWKKKFTTFHRISYKNSPHLLSNVYSIWFKFTRNAKVVSDSWGSGVSSWRHAGGQRIEPVRGRFFFCKNTENAVKKNNSPRFTAFTAFTAKRCKKYAVKIIFFSPHFTAFLTKNHHQTRDLTNLKNYSHW